eukprot:8912-Rhodomonas_salina.2
MAGSARRCILVDAARRWEPRHVRLRQHGDLRAVLGGQFRRQIREALSFVLEVDGHRVRESKVGRDIHVPNLPWYGHRAPAILVHHRSWLDNHGQLLRKVSLSKASAAEVRGVVKRVLPWLFCGARRQSCQLSRKDELAIQPFAALLDVGRNLKHDREASYVLGHDIDLLCLSVGIHKSPLVVNPQQLVLLAVRGELEFPGSISNQRGESKAQCQLRSREGVV